MILGGLQKFSLADYPGKASAILFVRGCNFRCPYCHNPELVDPRRFAPAVPEEQVFSFLKARVSKLQGVVISGGEPTIYQDLSGYCGRIKDLGFQVKLDTNGSNPDLLEYLLQESLIDAVSMDVKAPIVSYSRVVGVDVSTRDILRSIELIVGSGVWSELRTTYSDSLLTLEEMKDIGDLVRGCARYTLQPFRPTKTLDPVLLEARPPSREKLKRIRSVLKDMGINCELS